MATDPKQVFKSTLDYDGFKWKHIPYAERLQWNYLLRGVIENDTAVKGDENNSVLDTRVFKKEVADPSVSPGCPAFYNQDFCMALIPCPDELNTTDGKQLSGAGEGTGKGKTQNEDKLFNLSTGLLAGRSSIPSLNCWDTKDAAENLYPYFVKPRFNYHRRSFNATAVVNVNGTNTMTNKVIEGYDLRSLTVGSLVWMYFYERMGIFKILGVLLDDYNYKGKYSLSSQVKNGKLKNKNYVGLLEHLSVMSRQGIASTFRDRISTYQRVLGVTIQNDLNVQSSENIPFMKNFSKLISNMLDYYNAKRLAVAIQNNSASQPVRSSVATQTAILNSMKVLCQNFEVMEYGRNMVHTFTGITTIYTTLCLIKQIRDVIGIPREYDTPEEYVPAAYDILVLKKQGTSSDTNRYTVFDDCASYGYRILTDVQSANLGNLNLGSENTTFDAWLSSVEEWVEGYNNAFKSIPDKTNSESVVATV